MTRNVEVTSTEKPNEKKMEVSSLRLRKKGGEGKRKRKLEATPEKKAQMKCERIGGRGSGI